MSTKTFRRQLVLLYLDKVQNIPDQNRFADSRADLAMQAWSFAVMVTANEPTDVERLSDARYAEYPNYEDDK